MRKPGIQETDGSEQRTNFLKPKDFDLSCIPGLLIVFESVGAHAVFQ
jgi:hypothetical protein